MDLVFTFGGEAAQSVEALQPGSRVCSLGVNRNCAQGHNVTIHDLELGRISVFDSGEFEEVAEAKPIAIDLHSRHCIEQRDLFRLQQIGSTNEDSTRPI